MFDDDGNKKQFDLLEELARGAIYRGGVIRRFKTGHASALENRPPGGGYWVEESSSSDLRARGFDSVRPVCAGLPVSGGIAAA